MLLGLRQDLFHVIRLHRNVSLRHLQCQRTSTAVRLINEIQENGIGLIPKAVCCAPEELGEYLGLSRQGCITYVDELESQRHRYAESDVGLDQ